MPGRDGRWCAPYHTLSTVNGMALVHTWRFQRDGDAPWKNHQDAWLEPHSAAEPFCLAESPPTAHWAHKTLGERERSRIHASRRLDVSDMSCQPPLTRRKAGGKGDWSFSFRLEWGRKLRRAISGRNLNGRWRTRHSLLPVTLSLNLYPVLGCQTPSQIVTLNMAVNSKSVV